MVLFFDIFKSRTDEFFTLANLWHTRKIYAQGAHWHDTGYDAIGQHALPDGRDHEQPAGLGPPEHVPGVGQR